LNLKLSGPSKAPLDHSLTLTGSKSESNRLLLLQALYPQLKIDNLSNSDDARVMQEGLQSEAGTIDIHHAGTAMRFLTAYFASRDGQEVILTGSARMKQRPIQILVEALRSLGASIEYLETEGCPPLRIRGRRITGHTVSMPADVSSQYISALLLIAPTLPKGLVLELQGTITSVPYIRMTLGLLDQVGIANRFSGNRIEVAHTPSVPEKRLTVESDWSSASYYYSIAALSEQGSKIRLSAFHKNSLQGDSVLVEIFERLGVITDFEANGMTLIRTDDPEVSVLDLDLIKSPDLAQTLAATCFGLGIGCRLSGLHTLKIKETDRLLALERELGKLGAEVQITDRTLEVKPSRRFVAMQKISTYNDHRMAMAFAPLAIKTPLIIEDAGVVSKSYPEFWKDLRALGFRIMEI
jgi:3-phosphoshikimate 1-carboxyvinyltransferase